MSKHEEKSTFTAQRKGLQQTYDELKNCSSEELMQRLAQEIQSQKRNGVFDYEGLRASIDKMRIYLPAATYENMIRVIESLK